jgi:hypothetical protein
VVEKWLGVVSGFSFNQATEYTTSQGVVVSVDHPTFSPNDRQQDTSLTHSTQGFNFDFVHTSKLHHFILSYTVLQ